MLQVVRKCLLLQKDTFFQTASRNSHRKIIEQRPYCLKHIQKNQDRHIQTKTSNGLHTEKYLKHFISRKPNKNIECRFRTSAPKHVHPLLLALLKPLSRIVPMVAGRKIRKWRKNLSDSDKIKFKEAKQKYIFVLGGKSKNNSYYIFPIILF